MELGVQPGKKQAYARINEALKTIVTDFSNRDPIDYLGDIARVLNINVVCTFGGHCKSSDFSFCGL